MVVHRRKKVTKYRAHTTHGGGHRKKRRGAGSRGGRGKAGTGKRAGHKKAGQAPSLGKHGFKKKGIIPQIKAVNLSYFTEPVLEKLLKAGKIQKEGGLFVVDLKELGYNKLLGTGKITQKIRFIVERGSKKAAEKVLAAQGEVVIKTIKTTPAEKVQKSGQEPVEE